MNIHNSNEIIRDMSDQFIALINPDVALDKKWMYSVYLSGLLHRAFTDDLNGGELFDRGESDLSEFEKILSLAFYFRDDEETYQLLFAAVESCHYDSFVYFFNEVVCEVARKFEQHKSYRR